MNLFVCKPYNCRITKQACGKRHLKAMHGAQVARAAETIDDYLMRECKYCEVGAQNALGMPIRREKTSWSRKCGRCGSGFDTTSNVRKYCSKKCSADAERQRKFEDDKTRGLVRRDRVWMQS